MEEIWGKRQGQGNKVFLNIEDFFSFEEVKWFFQVPFIGNNDYFILRGIENLGKTELIVFDRRGVEVYKDQNYNNDWDGVDYNKNPQSY